jgi:Protein of unknown function (DUF2452)
MSDDRPKHVPAPLPQRASPFPLSRLSAPHTLLDVAREIQSADSMLSAVVGGKLESIARQIRALQQEAQQTLEQARLHAELHRAACHFKKIPGQVYHLYERNTGQHYFSLLSPNDWNGTPPHAYLGGYRLEADMRFTPAEEIERREQEWSQLRPLLTPPKNSEP